MAEPKSRDPLSHVYATFRDAYIAGKIHGRQDAVTVTYHLAAHILRKHQIAEEVEKAKIAGEFCDLIQSLHSNLLPLPPRLTKPIHIDAEEIVAARDLSL